MTSSSGESEEEVMDRLASEGPLIISFTEEPTKRRPEGHKKRDFSNPFFLSEGDVAQIVEDFLIPEGEFQALQVEIARVLQLPTSLERKQQWARVRDCKFQRCHGFLSKFQDTIESMVEFGAERNVSIIGDSFTRWPTLDAKPLLEDNGTPLKGHWGDILSVCIDDRKWVIKVIDIERFRERRQSSGEIATEDPISEIDCHRHLISLNTLYFPHLLDCVIDQTSAYFFIEQGEDLFSLSNRWHKTHSNESLPDLENVALNLFSDYLNALKVMHENGLTHSDIKLENMIWFETPVGPCGKLIDYGTCRRHKRVGEYLIKQPEYSGTLTNISPERYFHNNKEGARRYHIDIPSPDTFDASKDDIWAWACSLLSMFANGPVWEFPAHIRKDRGSSKRDDDQMFCITLATGGSYLPSGDDFAAKWFRRKRSPPFPLELAQLLQLTRTCADNKSGVLLSSELLDLFTLILVPESERPSISKILHHPWFRKSHAVE